MADIINIGETEDDRAHDALMVELEEKTKNAVHILELEDGNVVFIYGTTDLKTLTFLHFKLGRFIDQLADYAMMSGLMEDEEEE